MESLIVLIKKHNLEQFVLKWSGAFRYLNASFQNGFTKQDWVQLNQPIDNGIVNTMFRILLQEGLLSEPTPEHFHINNELLFQRKFEVIFEIVNFDFSVVEKKSSNLLWTVSSQMTSLIPNNITRHFGFLYSYMVNEISASQRRIVFLAPYFTESGIRQLIQSITAVLSNKSNIIIDFIVSDVESRMNKAAFEYLLQNLEFKNSGGNEVRIYEPINKEINNLWFHAKLLLIDNEKGYLGSANFSERALNTQFELGVILDKEQVFPIMELIDYWIKNKTFVLHKIISR